MRCLLALLLALLSSICCFGRALAQDAPLEQFSATHFVPAPGARNFLMVDGAVTPGHLSPSAGLMLDYAHRPFVLFRADCPSDNPEDCERGDSESALVEHQLTANLTGALTFLDRIQVGLVLPLAYNTGESFRSNATDGFVAVRGGEAFGIGDPRVVGKVNILNPARFSGFGLGAALHASVPFHQLISGDENCGEQYCARVGEGSVTVGGRLVASYDRERIHAAVNIGGVWRERKQLLSTELGPQLRYGVAGGYDVTPLVEVFGEVVGATGFNSDVDENPLEARLAGRLRFNDFLFTAGAGVGLVSGVGVPAFRMLLGGTWSPVGLDTDNDGVRDADDQCPAEEEDHDGFLDGDGCPDSDNDGDGIEDARDQCPDAAEDMDGYQDDDGCPDNDNDGDGIEDGYDSCPNKKEDVDGDRDDDGCPDNDTDRDGIPDAEDECPEEPEDTDGFGDEDGCPEEDFDGDGIPDDEDACPAEAEDMDGWEDDDGCPEDATCPPEGCPEAEEGAEEEGDEDVPEADMVF